MKDMQHAFHCTPARFRRFVRLSLIAIATPLVLNGCSGGSTADLHAYIKQVLGREGSRIEELPPVKPYELARYEGGKDPFEPFYQEEQASAEAQAPVVDPDANAPVSHAERGVQELENHALDSLRMLGSFEFGDTMFGIVRSPDGIVHRVKPGDYMGRNFGQIIDITEVQISLTEKFKDGQGRWQDREAALALVE